MPGHNPKLSDYRSYTLFVLNRQETGSIGKAWRGHCTTTCCSIFSVDFCARAHSKLYKNCSAIWHSVAELTNPETSCPRRIAAGEDDPQIDKPGQGNEEDSAPSSFSVASVDGDGVVQIHSSCLSSRSARATQMLLLS